MNHIPYILNAAYCDTEKVLDILSLAKTNNDNYKTVCDLISNNKIKIPKLYRSIIMKLLRITPVTKKIVGVEFNDWLKSFLHTEVNTYVIIPDITKSDYYDVRKFLKDGRDHISNRKNRLLANECVYGYYLEMFFQHHCEERNKGNINQSFKEIIHETFNITDTYGRVLRWAGKLWLEYKNIGKLSISIHRLYSHRTQIENLFKLHPELANDWREPVTPALNNIEDSLNNVNL